MRKFSCLSTDITQTLDLDRSFVVLLAEVFEVDLLDELRHRLIDDHCVYSLPRCSRNPSTIKISFE